MRRLLLAMLVGLISTAQYCGSAPLPGCILNTNTDLSYPPLALEQSFSKVWRFATTQSPSGQTVTALVGSGSCWQIPDDSLGGTFRARVWAANVWDDASWSFIDIYYPCTLPGFCPYVTDTPDRRSHACGVLNPGPRQALGPCNQVTFLN